MNINGKNIDDFRPRDVNGILDDGNIIYQQVFNHVGIELLSVDELPGHVSKGDVQYRIEVGNLKFGEITDFGQLSFKLANVFSLFSNAYFVCAESCIGMSCANGKYYLFDSHNRNKHGFREADGFACIVTFENFHNLCLHIHMLYEKAKVKQYEIWPSVITRYAKKNDIGDSIFCDMTVKLFHAHVHGDVVTCSQKSTKRKTSVHTLLPDLVQVHSEEDTVETGETSEVRDNVNVRNNEPGNTDDEQSDSTQKCPNKIVLTQRRGKWQINQSKRKKCLRDLSPNSHEAVTKVMRKTQPQHVEKIVLRKHSGKWIVVEKKDKKTSARSPVHFSDTSLI